MKGDQTNQSAGPVASATVKPTVILCIEDDPDSADLITAILRHAAEADFVVAPDGETGLELARERDPSLVILDLGLPDISGEEVLAELRAAPETESIPVVIVTSKTTGDPSTLPPHDAYVTKPIEDIPAFMEIVRRSLA